MFPEKGAIKREEKFDEYIKAFYERKYSSGFVKEMNRSAARYMGHLKGEVNGINLRGFF